MLNLSKKKQDNIIEYILYIWYVQDLLRAFDLDMRKIRINLIDKAEHDLQMRKELEEFYGDLVDQMEQEGKTKKGNLYFLEQLLSELNYLHQMLLFLTKDPKYIDRFEACQFDLMDLKSKNKNDKNDIEIMIEAFYGRVVLQMSKKSVSEQTDQSFSKITKVLSYLSFFYNKNYQNLQS